MASSDVVLVRVRTVVMAKDGGRLASKGATVARWPAALVPVHTGWRVAIVVPHGMAWGLTEASVVG